MKYLLLFAIILFAISSSAQNCTDESLLQTPGILKADTPHNSGRFSAADLAKHKKVLATIVNMIKSNYTPMGVKALFHENYGYPITGRPANDYGYSIIPLNFYCDGNTLKTAHETSTYFSITANYFDAEIYGSPNNEEASSGLGFHYIPNMPVKKEGFWYFNEIDAGLGFGMTGKSRAWLITYDGKLPFSYVTKKEFLEVQNKIVAKALLMAASGFKNILNNNEIEKGFKQKEYKNDPEQLKKYMKMDYLEVKARYEKLLSDNEKDYKPALEKIERQLKMPAVELDQQAIVKMDSDGNHSAYLFTDDSDPFGQVLIKPNPAYFKKLPKSSPQFFWVFLRGSHKDPIALKFMTDITKDVDFAVLKNMLGK